MAVFENTQVEDYDITGGTKDFDIVDKAGNKLDITKYTTIYIQVEYTALDVGLSQLTFKRSAVGLRYTEPPGGTLIMDAGADHSSDFNHANLGAKNLRVSFTKDVGDTVGTIQNIHVIAKT